MRKILLLIILFGATITGVRAQVGIGTQDPHSTAQLDITSDPGKKGLLIPRVQLTGIEMFLSGATSKGQMPNSILVFNTGTFTETINGVAKVFGPGYYYWDEKAVGQTPDGAWVALLSGGNAKNIQNFFNTINTNSSTVVYNSASNTFDLKVGNGLGNLIDASGNKYVGLGGALTTDTTIDLGGSKLKIKGLQAGNASSTIVTLNPTTNELQFMEQLNALQIATGGANNGSVLTVEGGKAKWIPVTGTASNSLVQVENGLHMSTAGKISLGGNLTKDTEIITTSTQTLAIKGLETSTTGVDRLVVADPVSGILKQIEGVSVKQIDAGTNTNKFLTVDKNGVVTWTGFGGTSTSSIDFSGLAGNGLVFNSASGTLEVQVENGLKIEDDKVKLGGNLTKDTEIITTSTQTLAIKGLETSATGVDRLVVADPVSGILKQIEGVSVKQIDAGTNTNKFLTVDKNGVVTWTGFGGTSTSSIDFSGLAGNGLVFNSASGTLEVQAENGLKVKDDKVKLGGDLTEDTKIDVKSHNLTIAGLKEGAATNTLVVRDAAGVLKYVDGVSTDQIKGGTTNAGKILTVNNAGVVTWTSLGGSATNTIDFSGLAGDGLTYSTTTGKLNVVPGNGIQIDGDNKVEWGGKLTKTATIETGDDKAFVIKPDNTGTRTTSNVVIEKLPTGTVSDSFVVVDGNGNLKKVDPKTAAKIDYTSTPTTTGRKWTVPDGSSSVVNKEIKEVTLRVDFGTGKTTVALGNEIVSKDNEINATTEISVINIRAIKEDATDGISITQSGTYKPSNGQLTLGMSGSMFAVTHKGWYYIVVEYYKK